MVEGYSNMFVLFCFVFLGAYSLRRHLEKSISRFFAEGSIHVMNYLTVVNSEMGLQNAKDYQGQKEVKNALGK